jgi:hypothetical protein
MANDNSEKKSTNLKVRMLEEGLRPPQNNCYHPERDVPGYVQTTDTEAIEKLDIPLMSSVYRLFYPLDYNEHRLTLTGTWEKPFNSAMENEILFVFKINHTADMVACWVSKAMIADDPETKIVLSLTGSIKTTSGGAYEIELDDAKNVKRCTLKFSTSGSVVQSMTGCFHILNDAFDLTSDSKEFTLTRPQYHVSRPGSHRAPTISERYLEVLPDKGGNQRNFDILSLVTKEELSPLHSHYVQWLEGKLETLKEGLTAFFRVSKTAGTDLNTFNSQLSEQARAVNNYIEDEIFSGWHAEELEQARIAFRSLLNRKDMTIEFTADQWWIVKLLKYSDEPLNDNDDEINSYSITRTYYQWIIKFYETWAGRIYSLTSALESWKHFYLDLPAITQGSNSIQTDESPFYYTMLIYAGSMGVGSNYGPVANLDGGDVYIFKWENVEAEQSYQQKVAGEFSEELPDCMKMFAWMFAEEGEDVIWKGKVSMRLFHFGAALSINKKQFKTGKNLFKNLLDKIPNSNTPFPDFPEIGSMLDINGSAGAYITSGMATTRDSWELDEFMGDIIYTDLSGGLSTGPTIGDTAMIVYGSASYHLPLSFNLSGVTLNAKNLDFNNISLGASMTCGFGTLYRKGTLARSYNLSKSNLEFVTFYDIDMLKNKFHFNFAHATISNEAITLLKVFCAKELGIFCNKSNYMQIDGHTDTVGSWERNIVLSALRAINTLYSIMVILDDYSNVDKIKTPTKPVLSTDPVNTQVAVVIPATILDDFNQTVAIEPDTINLIKQAISEGGYHSDYYCPFTVFTKDEWNNCADANKYIVVINAFGESRARDEGIPDETKSHSHRKVVISTNTIMETIFESTKYKNE